VGSYRFGVRATLAIGIGIALGCGSPEAPRTGPGPARPPAPEAPRPDGAAGVAAPVAREIAPVPPLIAPHGAQVIRVAVTDDGDAALSLDAGGELRLWPALDGTREPIVVRASAGRQLALTRIGGELVAAVADAAGGGEVQRFDAAGALVGRVTLAVEPAIEQLAIVGGVVLARRADQTLAAYGVRGDVRGRLAAPPGERLVSIVARGTSAAAAISGGSGPAVRALRRLSLGPPLAWGPRIELPDELSQLAISPSGRAIAGLAYNQLGRVIELEPRPQLVGHIAPSMAISSEDLPAVGFLDDDTAVMTSRRVQTRARRAEGGWSLEAIPIERGLFATAQAVVGDGAAVAGQGAGLAILLPRAKYLGYRDGGGGGEIRGGPLVLRTDRNRLLWLDDRLRAARVVDGTEAPSMRELARARALDDTHLAIVQQLPTTSARSRIAIRDVAAGTEQDLVRAEGLTAFEYDRGTRVLAAYGEGGVVRYRLSRGGPARLRGLRELRSLQRLYLTDPALAGGVVAIAIVGGTTVHAYTAPDESSGAALELQSKTQVRGGIFQVDRAGRIYTSESSALVISRDGKPISQIPIASVRRVAVTEDATQIALIQGNEVIVYDPTGTERWRVPAPNAIDLAWSSAGRLVVSTNAGLMAFDAATGIRTALACAWTFGLHDLLHGAPRFTMPSACAAE
jgi:hypothetical protein